MKRPFTTLCVIFLALSGCADFGGEDLEEKKDELKEKGDDIQDTVDDNISKSDQELLAEEIKGHIEDFVVCSEKIRPTTVQRIENILEDPNQDTLVDLVTAPEVLADVVAAAGTKVELSVILARNLLLLYEQGHVPELLENGFSNLSCDDTLTVACTAGTGSTTVMCTDGTVDGVQASFDGCILSGTQWDGSATFIQMAPTDMALVLDGLTLDEVDDLSGTLLYSSTGDAHHHLQLQEGEGFAITSHGGPEGGFSCGEALELVAFSVLHDGGDAVVRLDGQNVKEDERIFLLTDGEHLSYSAPLSCACPAVGSILEVGIEKAVAGVEGAGHLKLTYGEPSDSSSCASVQVEATQWPSDCSVLDKGGSDCGKSALEGALAPLLQAFCTTF
jgi:hypothetical protein